MMLLPRRYWVVLTMVAVVFIIGYPFISTPRLRYYSPKASPDNKNFGGVQFQWANMKTRYPVTSMIPMPSGAVKSIPQIQHKFKAQSDKAVVAKNTERRNLVLGNFTHAWNGYKKYAWMSDEVAPLSGLKHEHFGGYAATLVDALDTLWIMEMYVEFELAVKAVEKIDFNTCTLELVNVFETTIRYLGGLLAAHDLSNGKYPVLLRKAVELGEMLYVAFDTPNRMPNVRWDWKEAKAGHPQVASGGSLVSELGSLTLEFTRLSQLTGDLKYFDAVQRIMDQFDLQQNSTKVKGLWPVVINPRDLDFTKDNGFTLGGMADSLYEYLPKQHLLLGGRTDQYQRMYQTAMRPVKEHILFRPMLPNNDDILFPGSLTVSSSSSDVTIYHDYQVQHLGCFTGGWVGISSKIFNDPSELRIARKLTDGCIWGYKANVNGIMPEIMHTVPCADSEHCKWNATKWREEAQSRQDVVEQGLPQGISKVDDKRYILRPEAIESVFILYRITGDRALQEAAWQMWEAIIKHTITHIAHAALDDCTTESPTKSDRMESFWMAETLKYFYLIFSDPDVVSLDEWVLNTEAHPLRRPS